MYLLKTQEDQQLFQLVNTPSNGKKSSWSTIASQMPHPRTAKQCRERYVNNLNPDRKKSAWTAEEDDTIMKLQAKLGTQWTKIADREYAFVLFGMYWFLVQNHPSNHICTLLSAIFYYSNSNARPY